MGGGGGEGNLVANKTNRNKRSPRARPPPTALKSGIELNKFARSKGTETRANTVGTLAGYTVHRRGFASVEEKRGRGGGRRMVKGRKRTKPAGEDGLVT